jgi:hypothetical protein
VYRLADLLPGNPRAPQPTGLPRQPAPRPRYGQPVVAELPLAQTCTTGADERVSADRRALGPNPTAAPHGWISHRQHQAGCPPTVHRGSGSSPRWRQWSSVSRSAPSRSPVSASPNGSCFVCWSAMERRRPAPVGKAMPWEPTPAAVGYPFGGTRIRAGLASRGAVPDPHAEGDARRPAGGEEPPGGPPGAKRSPGCTGKPGDLPSARWRGYPNDVEANRPDPRAEGLTGTPVPGRSPVGPPRQRRTGRRW